eukprot:9565501-Ditylum_brightwellii.AAC.1
MLLEDEDLKRVRTKRSPDKATAAKNIWPSIALSPPLLVHRQAELVIRTYQTSLNNLLEKSKEFAFDIDAFCNYAGGDGRHALLKLYKTL